MTRVGGEIKRLREDLGWTQPRLAVEAGVAVSAVSQIENGRRSPNVGTLEKLAEALGVKVADFFREPALPKVEAPPSPEPPEEAAGEERRPPLEAAAALGPLADHFEWRRRPGLADFFLSTADSWIRAIADRRIDREWAAHMATAARELQGSLEAYVRGEEASGQLPDEEREDMTLVMARLSEVLAHYDLRMQEATDGEDREANPRQSAAGWK